MFWFLNNREYIDILYNRVKKRRMKRLLTCHKYEQNRHHQVLSCLVGWTTLDPSHIRPSWLRYPPIYVEKIRCNKPRAIYPTRVNYRTTIREDEPKPERHGEGRKFPSHCHAYPRGQTKTKPVENCCFRSWKRSLKDR